MKIDGVVEWQDDFVVIVEIERSEMAADVMDALAERIRQEVRVGGISPEAHFEGSSLFVSFDRQPHPAIENAAFIGWLTIICQDFEEELDIEFVVHLTSLYADHRTLL